MKERQKNQELQEYIREAYQAKREWEAAQNFFNNVVDPDLVDYAIYDLETTKRKYMYLIKKVRGKVLLSDEGLNRR
ncbi:MAG: DUF2508 family protein [Christensenellales bacterium]|jgi:protein subunit release factor A